MRIERKYITNIIDKERGENMDNKENNLIPENSTISQYDLLLNIWTKPKETIRYIIDTNPKQLVLILAILGGIFEALSVASGEGYGDRFSLINIYFLSIIFGSIGGILGLYITGFLLNWTGNWIGGNATSEEIRAAYAWGIVPIITMELMLLLPDLFFFGRDLYTSEMPIITSSPFLSLLLLVFAFAELVVGIWAIIVFLKCLGEVQGFSVWKALGNVLLVWLIVLIPVIIIMLLFF